MRTERMESGRTENKRWEPSSGGMGTRLNNARIRFTETMEAKKCGIAAGRASRGRKRSRSPNTSANARFEAGPAKLTFASPHF